MYLYVENLITGNFVLVEILFVILNVRTIIFCFCIHIYFIYSGVKEFRFYFPPTVRSYGDRTLV